MKRAIQLTADGSPTIVIPDMQVTYHSRHGAVQESRHVFIQAGLQPLLGLYARLYVFEMGLGTGLNALLTLREAILRQQSVFYQAAELYPLTAEETALLQYGRHVHDGTFDAYLQQIHQCPWEEDYLLHPLFVLHKTQRNLLHLPATPTFHLIYFDAFAPAAQPELWTEDVFRQLYQKLHPGGVLVTYCSKGAVRRAMQAAGFMVEKLPGPPGKREMLRAHRPLSEDTTAAE
jgi:tRNA U34 5-methylaminomethyl-2-thiouridine-forming methyltransferase MnmC